MVPFHTGVPSSVATVFLAIPWLDPKRLHFNLAGGVHLLGSQKDVHGPGVLEHVEKMKQDLLSKVKVLGRELPLNTLDELINHLGGPEHVAEVCQEHGCLASLKKRHWGSGAKTRPAVHLSDHQRVL